MSASARTQSVTEKYVYATTIRSSHSRTGDAALYVTQWVVHNIKYTIQSKLFSQELTTSCTRKRRHEPKLHYCQRHRNGQLWQCAIKEEQFPSRVVEPQQWLKSTGQPTADTPRKLGAALTHSVGLLHIVASRGSPVRSRSRPTISLFVLLS